MIFDRACVLCACSQVRRPLRVRRVSLGSREHIPSAAWDACPSSCQGGSLSLPFGDQNLGVCGTQAACAIGRRRSGDA